MVIDDVIINKSSAIEKCLLRIQEEFAGRPENLLANQTKQDSMILNLQRACELTIDLAMYVVSLRQLGVPQSSREAFDLLAAGNALTPELAGRMKTMVGFRNVAIHQYQKLDLAIVQKIIEQRLGDFREFITAIRLFE